MQNVLGAADDDGVPRVVAALAANHDLSVFGKKIDDLSFAFITPLGADENRIGHNSFEMNGVRVKIEWSECFGKPLERQSVQL